MDYETAYNRVLRSNDASLFRTLFPDRKEQHAFFEWAGKRARAKIELGHRPVYTRNDYIALIDEAKPLEEPCLLHIIYMYGQRYIPWIPVGHDDHFLYRIGRDIHEVDSLMPDPTIEWDDDIHLSGDVLAFQNKQEHGEDEFVFLQFGRLQYTRSSSSWPLKDGKVDDIAAEEYTWESTKFNLVAHVGEDGHVEGIYVVANQCIGIDSSGLPMMLPWGDGAFGRLPAPLDEKQFFCARLANRVSDFGPQFCVDWSNIVVEEGEDLVRLPGKRLVNRLVDKVVHT